MQYLFHQQASQTTLVLRGDDHRYIFKVRRHREGELIALRNLEDATIYFYRINTLTKKEAFLSLESSKILEIKANRALHLAWCVIDPKSIEKMLPTLNEMGVEKITFIYCDRSQKNFKLDFKRFEKILLNSSQQCGRSTLLELNTISTIQAFLDLYPESKMLNFSNERLSSQSSVTEMIIGCEGGFSEAETALFEAKNILGLDSPLILRSESAVCAVAAKLLI